ncbi:nipped-B-like protein B isoform X2 [Channa argus]|uniref:nipped-B-like protein B isoform X2 n=1 Tax=Channa argus TaxID=215402 RepID=UPI003522EFF5
MLPVVLSLQCFGDVRCRKRLVTLSSLCIDTTIDLIFSMNGDMPHVPITTLAGIASLTDLLNQLPLPSPLPATTAKSLLYNGRISEEVSSLLVCRDENLVIQLAHSLNQVSTEHIELKDHLGNDDPEGDMPMLLQTLLSRNPKIFRDKSMPNQYKVLGGVIQQPLIQQYKISQNQVHGSPTSNYQQSTVSQSPSGCFTSPQSGSATRFVPQQNSPIPSPYTPQSPADYMQYNPPSYSQNPQTQQVVVGDIRNIHHNKVAGQLSNSFNHNVRLGSDEEYMNIAHKLENEENDPSMRAVAFPVKSPQSVCSPAGSEKTAEKSRPPLIMQSPPPHVPSRVAPDLLLTSPDRKKKQKERSKEENEQINKNALYDIISSTSKDSARLTLKLSRVKVSDMDPHEKPPLMAHMNSDDETDLINSNNNDQLSRTTQPMSHNSEQANSKQAPVQPNSKTGIVSGVVYDDAEVDTLAELERVERESANERERWSKEVQDKDKPLKKRKQDSYPQESGADASDALTVQGGDNGIKLTPKKTSIASHGASRPALMVSIDLQQAGRVIGQPVVVLEAQKFCEDHIQHLTSETEGRLDKVVENRPRIIKQQADHTRKSGADGQPETLKQKQEGRRESKHRHDGKTDSGKGHSDDRRPDTPRQKHDKHLDSRQKQEKNHNSHGSQVSQPETPKAMTKAERNSRHREDKTRNRDRDKDKEREKGRTRDRDIDSRDREKERNGDKDKYREKHRDGDRERDRDGDREKDRDGEKEKDRFRDREINRGKDRHKDRDREKKKHTMSKENYNRHCPDGHTKSDGPKLKQDGSRKSTDLDGRQRTESSTIQNPKHKKEKKTGDDNHAGNKHSFEKKTSVFPSYLLGGTSGSLKNFVIPKLKRDGTDKNPKVSNELISWSKPLVRLERVSLIENLNKGAKPIVVLEKLTTDEVKKIIRESRNAHRSRNRPCFDEPMREMSFCERTNKRRHSVISKSSKYAEVDSEEEDEPEDNDDTNDESARKRYKKDKYKKWKHDGKQSSGDHHRSGGFHGGSDSRHHKRSPDNSDEGCPPPSINDVARELKKKEKQKSRKPYDSKLTTEEKMDSSTFKRFSARLDNILENLEDVDLVNTDDDEIPQELLLGKHQLSELASDSAKIKAMSIFNKLSSDKLVKILNILEKNIQDSVKLSTLINHDNDSMDEERLWRDLIMERVTKSADACLTALNIMTSPRMPKAVYIEDVIERVLQYTKFHLQNSLYPQYDPVYRVDPHGGGVHTSKSKRAKSSTHKQKVVLMLYNKVCEIVSYISELLEIQLLTDTTILQVSTLGITPFFVENVSELQLCAITLVTAVFSRYEKHRQLILEEIFTSLARLPTSKRNLRNFRLNSSDSDGEPLYIQMVTALVLQLIQCVVHLPSQNEEEEEHNKKVDKDFIITNSYETAMRTAQNFLSVFLKKCGSKQGEEDYRPLFENFVHDLLSTVNRPEWPAAELLLSLLGRLLVHQFSNKQTEMALRVASLDYLGTVASRLRKDAVTSKMDQKAIDRILRETSGNDEIQQLQKALLDYLDGNVNTEPSLIFARKFYIAQWFRDITTEAEKAMKSQNENNEDSKGRHHSRDVDLTGEIMQKAEAGKKFLRKVIKTSPSQFSSLRINSDTVDYEDSCLIVRYLASMRPFAQSFDVYLSQILRVLGESAIAVRTKAMKCLSEVVAVDPSILARLDMQRGVHCRLMDNSTSVREAAVELLGRFVLSRPQLIEQYYDMLIERILDTGISVRKRVIKILRDICLEHPDFHKITEMCVRMIRRVNDEEGIKKLVNETFQKLWFTPTPSHDKDAMTRKILNITDVVSACKDSGYDWFEQLLQNLLKSEENASYKPAKKACVQLVDNLVEHILKYEESLADCEDKLVTSDRLVACITTLYLFSKIRARLMVKHAMTMQPYLTTKCNTQNDFMVICNVAKILELVVPLMEHPSETFLTTMEEDLMKLIFKYGMTVVQHCVSCLGAIVNKVTHNYRFIWACFNRYYGALAKLKTQHQEDPTSSTLVANKPTLLRSLFTVGALCRHFDFDQEEFKGGNKIVIKDKVLELLLYFTNHEDEEVQIKATIGLGFQFIGHPELMFVQDVKVLYNSILSDENSLVSRKIQVLKNLQTYLQEEDSRMQEADREWNKQAKQEDLKEMGDISSGMSSSIMQIYLKQVLESFFHSQSTVRHFALSVITLTLSQGLIHPVQCVPYLIAMGTDPEPTMKNKADQQLVEIDKKYSGFIHMKAVAGLKMSYQVQQAINGSKGSVRGFRREDSDSALCSHLYTMVRGNRQHRRAFLISLLNLFDDSSKIEVNMLLFIADNLACFPYQTQEEPLFIMHHIDITLSVSGSNLLQSFKESLQKEPVPQEKKMKVKKKKKKKKKKLPLQRKYSSDDDDDVDEYNDDEQSSSKSSSSDEDDEIHHRQKKSVVSDSDSDLEDEDAVMDRLPENPNPLLDFASASQGILLLLMLKQHLKNLYGFSDSKIQKYSPTESAKVYDKAVNRKSKVHFNPRQTLDYLKSNLSNKDLSYETKRNIVKQYLDFKVLMEHLDRDEEDEEGEANANARNKAINSLLKGPKLQNHNHNNHTALLETDDEESEDEDPPARKPRKGGDSAEDSGHMNETVEVMDVIAICCPKYKDRPQIARVIQKTKSGYNIHWMTGSYSGPWAEAKKRDGRKKVPCVGTIKESEIIYKKISLTSGQKLTNKVAQTLRALYAAKEGTKS